MRKILDSRKGMAFVIQFFYYAMSLGAIVFRPEIAKPEVLSFLGVGGLCLASYHATQGAIDFIKEKSVVK